MAGSSASRAKPKRRGASSQRDDARGMRDASSPPSASSPSVRWSTSACTTQLVACIERGCSRYTRFTRSTRCRLRSPGLTNPTSSCTRFARRSPRPSRRRSRSPPGSRPRAGSPRWPPSGGKGPTGERGGAVDWTRPGILPDALFALDLEDLPKVGSAKAGRLRRYGIESVRQFYDASLSRIRDAYGSVDGERIFASHART